MLMPPGVPSGLVLVGRAPVEALLDPPGVVPSVDVAEQRALRIRSGRKSGCGPMDQLDLEGRPQVFGEGIVEAIADAAGGRRDAGVDESLGESHRGVLTPLVAVKPNSV